MARRKKEDEGFFSKKNLIGLFIVGIMVLSGLGYMVMESSGPNSNEYNGHKFQALNSQWYTEIDGNMVGFTFLPGDLARINVSQDLFEYLKSVKMVYVVYDANSSLVQDFELIRMQLESEMPVHLGIYPSAGITSEDPAYELFPVITCENATVFTPVIYLRQGKTEIIGNGTCIIIQAEDSYDVPAVKDRLMYGLYGIM
jgi:hypothetical protein